MVEGMLLHGILHRVEADSGNVRAWVGNVCDAVETEGVGNGGEVNLMEFVWSDIVRERVMGFINAMHTFRKDGQRDGEELEGRSRRRSCSGVQESLEKEDGRMHRRRMRGMGKSKEDR